MRRLKLTRKYGWIGRDFDVQPNDSGGCTFPPLLDEVCVGVVNQAAQSLGDGHAPFLTEFLKPPMSLVV